jgi:hypothetical protein
MTAPTFPRIWFERPVLPAFVPVVEAACSVCGPTSADDRYSGIETAVAAVVGATPYDDAVMARAADLVVIARTGIGYDAIDVDAATRHGILICNAPDGPTISTAEHAITLMLAVAKRLGPAVASLRDGTSAGYYAHHEGIELDGKVLGLVGFGRIARRPPRRWVWPSSSSTRTSRRTRSPRPSSVSRASTSCSLWRTWSRSTSR